MPSYSTRDSVRIPDTATEPNRTMPAPPSTGDGIAATTWPSTGKSPSTNRTAPPAATANRDRMPVIATRPTFCANADAGNELRNGATSVAAMSARRPSPTRFASTLVSSTSPMAMRSAVVSVMITRMTIVIEMIAPISNTGAPNANGVGSANADPSPTPEKSARPSGTAATVPRMMPNRMDSREIVPCRNRLRASTTTSVPSASAMLGTEPQSAASSSPPIIQPAAVGSSETPMIVMMVPVTTGGKNRTTCAKNGLIARPMTAATMMAPKTGGSPPSPLATATMVDTVANEMPWTSGSCDPKKRMPSVWSAVARPLTSSAAETRTPISAPVSPAACPTMIGGAMTPPYIVMMCCRP